MTTLRYN